MYRSTCSSLCLALTQARTLLYGIDWIYYIEYAGARCLLSFRLSQTHQESFKLLLQIYYCIFFGFFDVSAIVASEYNSVYSRTGHSLASSGGMIASYAAGRVLTVGVFRSICDLDSNEPVMVELHQLDTFYNSLNTNDQDALDSAAGGNFLDKMPRDGLAIIESKSKRIKVRENDKPSAQHSRFLKMFKQLRLEIGLKDALVEMPKFNKWLSSLLRNKDEGSTENRHHNRVMPNEHGINLLPHSIYKQLGTWSFDIHHAKYPRVPIILGRPFLRTAKALIDLYEETLTLRVGKEEVFFSREDSDNLEKFTDELTPLNSLPPGDDVSIFKKDSQEGNFQIHSNSLFEFDDNFKSMIWKKMSKTPTDDTTHNLASEVTSNQEPEQNESSITFSPRSDPLHHKFAGEVITLPSRNDREFGEYLFLMTVLCEISTSRSQENVHANQSSVIESLPVSPIPVEDNDRVQEEIDIFHVSDDLIPPGFEDDDSEDEDNELPNLDHQDDPSNPRLPPEPPDIEKCFEPEAGISTKVFKGVSKPHDFMADILPTLPTLVSDLIFISSFFSFGNEDTIFDPGIVTFHKPVAFSMKVSCSKCCFP
ncbi:hypothetical protein Tco_0401590 [Tanacetum coccineum]